MIAATYLRYIVQRITHLIYARRVENKALVVPLLSSSLAPPAAHQAPASNKLFWKEEEQRQKNQDAEARRT
jgi:hypothetical protein